MHNSNTKKSNKKVNHTGTGFVRIIAGKWRGRKLPVKDLEGLRPTTDRVKETLFNWLQSELYQSYCLDLFAGSGALGFEALSRGVAHVTFVEKSVSAHSQLMANVNRLQISNATLHKTDAFDFLANAQNKSQSYDLIFIDPPFHLNLLEKICEKIDKSPLVADNAIFYVESELSAPSLPLSWQLIKEKKAGQVYFRLFRKASCLEKHYE